jgi:hypothetical protein
LHSVVIMKFIFSKPSLLAYVSSALLLHLNGSFGSGFQEPRYQEMLEKVRNELSGLNS